MFQRLAQGFLASLILATAAQAQIDPPPLDGPTHWDVHGDQVPGGPVRDLGFDIHVNFLWFTHMTAVYLMVTEVGDQSIYSFAYVHGDGTIEVHNGDSGNITRWEWKGDHYEKVGGTAYHREYWPAGR